MSQGIVLMVDTIHADVNNIPVSTLDVAGYISGTADIDWTSGDWARFSKDRRFRIWQGFGPRPPVTLFDVIDVEAGAVTPSEAAQAVRDRVNAGIQWTTIYGSDAALAAVSSDVQAEGHDIWNGHVNAWLADWNLSQNEAGAKLLTSIHGMTCVAVQWASPSSNPNTILPGTGLTLRQSNCDLSVALQYWTPSGGWDPPAPAPVPPPVAVQHGVIVTLPDGHMSNVISADGGHTWHV